ncbi:MAG: hypothetical protein JKY27_10350 [Magnetovibrio sp.]|nr:hypothetical protein [Magnetovibrio sp.]
MSFLPGFSIISRHAVRVAWWSTPKILVRRRRKDHFGQWPKDPAVMRIKTAAMMLMSFHRVANGFGMLGKIRICLALIFERYVAH